MPSSPIAQAWRNIASPSTPTRWSLWSNAGSAAFTYFRQAPALDKLVTPEIVTAHVQEVERIEARCSGPSAA